MSFYGLERYVDNALLLNDDEIVNYLAALDDTVAEPYDPNDPALLLDPDDDPFSRNVDRLADAAELMSPSPPPPSAPARQRSTTATVPAPSAYRPEDSLSRSQRRRSTSSSTDSSLSSDDVPLGIRMARGGTLRTDTSRMSAASEVDAGRPRPRVRIPMPTTSRGNRKNLPQNRRRARGAGGGVAEQPPAEPPTVPGFRQLRSGEYIIPTVPSDSSFTDFFAGTSRGLSSGDDVAYLASTVVFARLARFVRGVVDNYHESSNKAVSFTRRAVELTSLLALDHVWDVLRHFVFVYTSFRAKGGSIERAIIIQGSFLPDFMEMVDEAYDDGDARMLCPATESVRRRSLRPERGLVQRRIAVTNPSRSYTQTVRVGRGRGVARTVDRSCVLVSDTRMLSKRFFNTLSAMLSNYMQRETSSTVPHYRFSREFAIEVNQAYTYIMERALRYAFDVAQSGVAGSRQAFRVNERDVEYAFSLMRPCVRNRITRPVERS